MWVCMEGEIERGSNRKKWSCLTCRDGKWHVCVNSGAAQPSCTLVSTFDQLHGRLVSDQKANEMIKQLKLQWVQQQQTGRGWEGGTVEQGECCLCFNSQSPGRECSCLLCREVANGQNKKLHCTGHIAIKDLDVLVPLSAALLPTASLVEASKRVSGLTEWLKISMPAVALLAFQFLGLLWLAEMQETVRSFPVAGISGLEIKRRKREALLRGETVTVWLITLGCHWGWHCIGKTLLPWRTEEWEWLVCEWKLRTEKEWTRITSRQLDLGTHWLHYHFLWLLVQCPSRRLGGRAQVGDGVSRAKRNCMEMEVMFSARCSRDVCWSWVLKHV